MYSNYELRACVCIVYTIVCEREGGREIANDYISTLILTFYKC